MRVGSFIAAVGACLFMGVASGAIVAAVVSAFIFHWCAGLLTIAPFLAIGLIVLGYWIDTHE